MTTNLTPEIIHLTHIDLDAMGCILSVCTLDYSQKIFSTNYVNMSEVVDNLTDTCYRTHVKMILITDLSFSGNKKTLEYLEALAKKLNVPIILIDHHEYKDNFFDSFKYLKIIHDIKHSASYLTQSFLKTKGKSEHLDRIIDLCDTFDIWQSNKPNFVLSLGLNSYFWENVLRTSLQDFAYKICNNGFRLPVDFKNFYKHYIIDSKSKIESYRKRKLITSDGFFSVAFIDEYFTEVLYEEFQKNVQFVMIANSYGITRFRFKDASVLSRETKEKIKLQLMGTLEIGHLNAFSDKIKNSDFDKIMNRVKEVHDIVESYKPKN